MSLTPFILYNASAGSGKTYALAKQYLKIVLASSGNFKKILALTFTNKAVNEMKNRVLDSLYEFSNTTAEQKPSPLFNDILTETGHTPKQLSALSELRLKQILHNYAFFDISTIDKFTHRLIRTFAKDLKIPQNFEVVIDKDPLLQEAVERLINKAGEDPLYTKILLDFALDKIDDNKSWDISMDLLLIGNLLFNENHVQHLKRVQEKDLKAFLELQKQARNNIRDLEKKVLALAKQGLDTLLNSGQELTDFPRQTLPNHFKKILEGNFSAKKLYDNKLEKNLREGKILKARIALLDASLPNNILAIYLEIKAGVYARSFFANIAKHVIPFALLNAIQEEVTFIQQEKDQLSISEFNTLIANEIKDQPAPFIYERLGEKYRYYFIDEFQDTSQMQWENLIPLIGNALEAEDEYGKTGSLFLVGDAKQAIYRFRGGHAEQFLNLATHKSRPFTIDAHIETLPTNYRSHEEIIKFTNAFFQSVSSFLVNPVYKEFFKIGNKQEVNHKKGGLVQLTLLPENTNEAYINKTLSTIEDCILKGYEYGDICIVVRTKRYGLAIADALIAKGIPVISPDSLLLSGSAKIMFLIALLRFQIQPNEKEIQYEILTYLSKKQKDSHLYIATHLGNLETHFKEDLDLDIKELRMQSVYDGLETVIKVLNLSKTSDAHVTALMDMAFDLEQREGSDIQTFLNYWDKKGHNTSISMPENLASVQIMTIHKSKGLEFPVVIFPFANSNVFSERKPMLWLSVTQEKYAGFSELLVSKSPAIREYNKEVAAQYDLDHEKTQLDAYNLLYVALTRAESALFVISAKGIDSKGNVNTDSYPGLFIHYLKECGLWAADKTEYTFGNWIPNTNKKHKTTAHKDIPYIYTNKDRADFKIIAHAGMLWDKGLNKALNKGNLIHNILGTIYHQTDVNRAVQTAYQKGAITQAEINPITETLNQVVHHPKLKNYFLEGFEVINERDILLADGTTQRPDKVVIQNKEATIIDYKTGEHNHSYYQQIETYAGCFQEMGYRIKHKIIVYINEEIQVEYI